ncbi:hypothetical protein A9Q78_05525 [Methylophaga sp. 41_12_T18]|nr:hypothetical protein A9Q78_05525 [Methylophaga sp. 41_12_T18]
MFAQNKQNQTKGQPDAYPTGTLCFSISLDTTKTRFAQTLVALAESRAIGLLIIIGLPIYGIMQLVETVGWITILVITTLLIVSIICYQKEQKQKKKENMTTNR